MIALARQAAAEGWSVREMEARVRGDVRGHAGDGRRASAQARPSGAARRHRRRAARRGRAPQAPRHGRAGHHAPSRPRIAHRQLLLERRSCTRAGADPRRSVRGMRHAARAVTIVVQPDGATRSQTYRMPVWIIRAGLAFLGAAVVGVMFAAALYGPLARAAARVPGLEHRVARLEADNAKVRQLSAALDSVESRYAQVREMIGGDIVRDPLTLGAALPVAPAVLARVADAPRGPSVGLSLPRRWPLDEAGVHHPWAGRHRHRGRGAPGPRHRRRGREHRAGVGRRERPPAWRRPGVRLLRTARSSRRLPDNVRSPFPDPRGTRRLGCSRSGDRPQREQRAFDRASPAL